MSANEPDPQLFGSTKQKISLGGEIFTHTYFSFVHSKSSPSASILQLPTNGSMFPSSFPEEASFCREGDQGHGEGENHQLLRQQSLGCVAAHGQGERFDE